jgi:quercetin dioxygenase-like cupin family protein
MAMTEPRGAIVVRGSEAEWRPLQVAGISIKLLRDGKDSGESTFLLRFQAGARFPAHNHPAGEQVFVLEGDVLIGRDRLKAGDFLYTPPNGTHAVSSDAGCLLLVTLPKPIEILMH